MESLCSLNIGKSLHDIIWWWTRVLVNLADLLTPHQLLKSRNLNKIDRLTQIRFRFINYSNLNKPEQNCFWKISIWKLLWAKNQKLGWAWRTHIDTVWQREMFHENEMTTKNMKQYFNSSIIRREINQLDKEISKFQEKGDQATVSTPTTWEMKKFSSRRWMADKQ